MALGLGAAGIVPATIDQSVITIHSFPGGDGGGKVWGGLTPGGDGNYYGTTVATSDSDPGTFFSVTPSGAASTLHIFSVAEGNGSLSSLLLAADGNFYGTSYSGCLQPTAGCIFKLTKAGVLTPLVNFDDTDARQPNQPYARLTQGRDGNFYGTTNYGGADNVGTIFKMTTSGHVTVLHEMVQATEGSYPSGALVEGSDGNFYGTTQNDGSGGRGSVFRVTSAGVLTTIHNFSGTGGDGGGASWGVAKGPEGYLYGVTWGGGGQYGGGTIFRVSEAGDFAIVHAFDIRTEYNYPYAGLTFASDGKLYGTTLNAPVNSPAANAIFRFTPSTGTVETLHLFSAAGDGKNPYSEMIQGADGDLYGTTYGGGDYGLGTIFKFDIGAAVPVAPTVTIAVSPATVNLGAGSIVYWSSTGATSCTASGAWSGSKALTGNQTVTPAAAGSFTYTLSCTGSGGSATQSTTLIVQPAPKPGSLQLSAGAYTINENGGSVTMTVRRINGSDGAVAVNYTTSGGTATAGSDYTAKSGTLSWADGDAATKTFAVSIDDDAVHEGNETVNLALSNAAGGATLGNPSTAVLTIVDNETAGADTGGDGGTHSGGALGVDVLVGLGIVLLLRRHRLARDGRCPARCGPRSGLPGGRYR